MLPSQALERDMKKKVLVIAAVATVAVLATGWAFAQSQPHEPGFGPAFRQHGGPGNMDAGAMPPMGRGVGPGMMHMGRGMGSGAHSGMGPGMMGHGMGGGPGMGRGGPGRGSMKGPTQRDGAVMDEMRVIHSLFANHDSIKRMVTNLPNGIRTVTESDDPEVAATLKEHVATMIQRVGDGRNPNLPIQSPALNAIYANRDKIRTEIEETSKGAVVVQTSDDAATVAALQKHAGEVSDFAREGMPALHNAMAARGGMGPMMMHGSGSDARN